MKGMKKQNSKIAFPLETLFTGLHERRPDIAAAEAEVFLRDGHMPDGFDLSKPSVRRKLLGRKPFVDFAIWPLPPAIAAELAKLPDGWQQKPASYALAEAINTALEQHFTLPATLYVSVNEENVPWVREKV